MKLNLEKTEGSRAVLEVEIESENVDKALDAAYHRLVKYVNVPGFRKGKAPRAILERHIGKPAFYKEALDQSIGQWYQQAVTEAQIQPIADPSIEILEFEIGKPIKFKATVDVKPEVKLGDYKNISLAKEKIEVTPEDVDKQIEAIRESHSKLVPVEDGIAEEGLYLTIDMNAEMDGVEFRPMTAQGMFLELKESRIFPNFLENLKGAKDGEEREFSALMPEDHPVESARGKQLDFRIIVKEIKKLVMPDIDESFAKDAGFESLQDMRAAVENNLKTTRETAVNRAFDIKVVEMVTNQAEVDLPETLVNAYANQARKDLENRLEAKSITIEQYLSITSKNKEDLDVEILERAQNSTKADLVLEAIGEKEAIEPAPEEIEEAVESIAKIYEKPLEEVKINLQKSRAIEAIKDDIKKGKTVRFLSEIAMKNAEVQENNEEEATKQVTETEEHSGDGPHNNG